MLQDYIFRYILRAVKNSVQGIDFCNLHQRTIWQPEVLSVLAKLSHEALLLIICAGSTEEHEFKILHTWFIKFSPSQTCFKDVQSLYDKSIQ